MLWPEGKRFEQRLIQSWILTMSSWLKRHVHSMEQGKAGIPRTSISTHPKTTKQRAARLPFAASSGSLSSLRFLLWLHSGPFPPSSRGGGAAVDLTRFLRPSLSLYFSRFLAIISPRRPPRPRALSAEPSPPSPQRAPWFPSRFASLPSCVRGLRSVLECLGFYFVISFDSIGLWGSAVFVRFAPISIICLFLFLFSSWFGIWGLISRDRIIF